MATETGVWNLQEVRDKQLASEWTYNAPSGDTGALWAWGSAQYGTLGLNDRTTRSSPMQVGTDTTWKTVTAGGDSDCMLGMKGDGSLWSWGKNNSGELGLNEQGPSSLRSSPTQIPGTWSSHSSRGIYHKFGIKDGKLYAWGANTEGELGLNDIVRRSSPTQIGTGTDWSSVDGIDNAGGAAIKTDGTLWVWGRNNMGQLGLNYVVAEPGGVSSPAQIPGTWSRAQGSYLMGMGLKPDGTLWSWGSNLRGQLGQNTDAPAPYLGGRSSPVQIPGAWSDFAAAGIGLGLKTDGTLWAWGNNQNGPLGQNEPGPSQYSSPTQVGTDSTWSDVAASVFALKTDGSFWSWGNNLPAGQLGLNDKTKRSSPTQVGGATDWLRMGDGGGYSQVAIREG
jgi:alpha-tubulin suppressor-like RCC1 family protein